jgi:hypothetical protein
MMRLPRTVPGAAVVLALLFASAVGAPVAAASTTQEATFQDDALLRADPGGTLATLRQLGVARVRVFVSWSSIAPSPLSARRPTHFVASNPASYPASKWSVWDAIVRAATSRSIGLDFVLTGGAPLWATGSGAPAPRKVRSQWKPSAHEFGQFVRAIGERYSGNYNPGAHKLDPASANDLPPVDYWAIWNEPDYGPSLAPQGTHNSTVEYAARMYRDLVDAAWSGLQATGHRYDTILIGELAPRGSNNFGLFSGTKPLRFLRALYCVDAGYQPLLGLAAALRGCPTSVAGRRGFRRVHPALFNASGISDHPYSQSSPPNVEALPDRDFTSLADLSQLERSADRLQRVYGSPTQMPVYLTEYGYITSPPKRNTRKRRYVSPATAAYYMNWAEYIAWRDPRVMTISQYLLLDPMRPNAGNDYGGFASGLILRGGLRKATYDAYRLPIYMPVTRTRSAAKRLEIWGSARPAGFAFDDTSADQSVAIQFQPYSRGPFVTLATVPIINPAGYFDVRQALPSSGSVRLAWTYPNGGATVHGRSVKVTVG